MKWMLLLLVFFIPFFVEGAAPSLVAIPTPQNLTEDASFYYDVNATDPEGGPLYFSDDSPYFSIDEDTGVFSFTPSESLVGSFVAVIIVRDNESLIDAQAVEFIVNGRPDIDPILDQSVTAGDIFYYDVNATDPEDGGSVIFYDNTSMFNINSITGEINLSTNTGLVGDYSINISVADTEGVLSSSIFNLAINDYPNITGIPNSSATEDNLFTLNVSSYLDNEVGTLYYYDNTSLFDINSSTGIISFTPTLAQVGYYSINLSVNDSFGLSDSQNWFLNITQINDPPLFEISNQTGYVGSNFTLTINATDEENNTIYYYDNATFFDIGVNSGVINFYLNSSLIGNHSINITVNDSLGAESSDIFNLRVVENIPPSFPRNITKKINPNFDSYVNQLYNTTSYQGSESLYLADALNAIERTYINFSLEDIPSLANINWANLNLTIEAGSLGTQISALQVNSSFNQVNLTYSTQPNISIILDNLSSADTGQIDSFNISNLIKSWFNDSEEHYGVSLRIKNESENTGSEIVYYSSDSSNSSKWPALYVNYNSYLANQTVAVGDSISEIFDLDDYFYDSEGTSLTYNVSTTGYSTVSIDSNNIVSISGGSSAGTDSVNFSASDGINITYSNQITVTVSAGGGSNVGTSSSSSSGGGGGSSQRTASLNIMFDSERETVEEGDIIQIPVIFENSGQIEIRNINLDLDSDASGLDLRLSESVIASLDIGETYDLTVVIDSTDTSSGSYVITLNANTDYPSLSESAIFVLDVGGIGEAIEKNLVMVQDLFQNNPECMELQELVDKAEVQLSTQNYEEAKANIALAIEGCKNMVRIQNEPLKSNSDPFSLVNVLMLLGVLTILIVIGYSFLMKARFSKKKRR